jgi:hypothetical protein
LKGDLHDFSGSIVDFSKTIELEPEQPDGYYSRGLVEMRLGQKENGCIDLSKAAELGYQGAYDLIRKFCNYCYILMSEPSLTQRTRGAKNENYLGLLKSISIICIILSTAKIPCTPL